MSDSLLAREIAFSPVVEGVVPAHGRLVCGGVGGSALPAMILSRLRESQPVELHRDYGLPDTLPENALYVALSYSGNTEETLSFANAALGKSLPLAIITSGGALAALAREKKLPHVLLQTGMQPRDAILSATKALATLTEATDVTALLNACTNCEDDARPHAGALVEALKDAIPVIYSSRRNHVLSYLQKITFNETAKVPAFSNVFPELNHNEMQGLDPLGGTAPLLTPLSLLILRDPTDNPRVTRRMAVFEELLRERGARIRTVTLPEGNDAYRLVWAWQLARIAAHGLAEHYGVEADAVPLVEEFKKRLS